MKKADDRAIVARCLHNALTLGDKEGWQAFSQVAAVRLTSAEKAGLAYSALRAQSPTESVWTCQAALDGVVENASTPFIDTPRGRDAIIAWRQERDARRVRVGAP